MSKRIGASGAFQEILQKVDETFIEAQAHLRCLRADVAGMNTESNPDLTCFPSPVQSERSCSPPPLMKCISPADTVPVRQKFMKEGVQNIRNEAYQTFDKKEFVIKTSFESNNPISEAEVKKIQKLIEDVLYKNTASCCSSSTISSTMII